MSPPAEKIFYDFWLSAKCRVGIGGPPAYDTNLLSQSRVMSHCLQLSLSALVLQFPTLAAC